MCVLQAGAHGYTFSCRMTLGSEMGKRFKALYWCSKSSSFRPFCSLHRGSLAHLLWISDILSIRKRIAVTDG